MLPGLGNSSGDYHKFAELLQDKYNCDVEIAQVARIDWARNAAGLTDARYWKGTLSPRPTVDWYLNRIDGALTALKDRGHTCPNHANTQCWGLVGASVPERIRMSRHRQTSFAWITTLAPSCRCSWNCRPNSWHPHLLRRKFSRVPSRGGAHSFMDRATSMPRTVGVLA